MQVIGLYDLYRHIVDANPTIMRPLCIIFKRAIMIDFGIGRWYYILEMFTGGVL